MKEKQLYLKENGGDFQGTVIGRQVTRDILFSEDPKDMGYIAENVPCQNACPAATNIPGYIRCVWEKRYGRAYEINRMVNIMPGVLGRICSRPCESKCRHGEADLGKSVNICYIKRSAADLKVSGHRIHENLFAPSGKTVAVVGAGPSGLAAAHELTTLGHKVTIFEAMDKPGGMLRYGIPEFRLPRDIIDMEVENILRLGVDLRTGVEIGSVMSVEDIMGQYDASIITVGCMNSNKLNIPGEDLEGVYSGLEFMMSVNAGESVEMGENVVVIGGGYTAVDCARSAIRMGASKVSINVRKTEEFMPIDDNEKHEVRFEKIRIYSLVRPTRIIGKNGKVEAVAFERTTLESTDDPKVKKVIPIENTEFEIPADNVIIAIGQHTNTGFTDKIKLNGSRVWTEPGTYRTNIKNLFTAGDCVTGTTNVITAIANGRKSAHEVDELFIGRRRKAKSVRFEPWTQTDRERAFDFIPPVPMPATAFKKRIEDPLSEVETGYDAEEASEEAKRCYLCMLKYEIDTSKCIYCFACIDVAPRDCIKKISGVTYKEDGSIGDYIETNDWSQVHSIAIDNKRCIRCGQCYEVCPMQCISIKKVELIERDLV